MSQNQLLSKSPTPKENTLQALWKFKTEGRIYSSACSYNGLVYFGSEDKHIYALDSKTGKQQWTYATAGAVNSSPVIAGNKIYVLSMDGFLYSLDATTGKLIWRFQTEGERREDMWDYYLSDPIVSNNTVYFGSSDNHIYAVDATVGTLIWKYKTQGKVHAKPVINNDTLFVGAFDGRFYSLDAKRGNLLWEFRSIGDLYFPKGELQKGALLHDNKLWVGSRDYNIYALNPKTGRGTWNMKENGSWIIATPLAYQNHLYFGTSDSHVFYNIDINSGQTTWKLPLNMRVYGSAIAHEGLIYFGCFNGKLYGVDPLSGTIKKTFQTEGSKQNYTTVFGPDDHFRKDFSVYGNNMDESMKSEEKILQLGSITATPLSEGGVLYFGSTDGNFYALKTQ